MRTVSSVWCHKYCKCDLSTWCSACVAPGCLRNSPSRFLVRLPRSRPLLVFPPPLRCRSRSSALASLAPSLAPAPAPASAPAAFVSCAVSIRLRLLQNLEGHLQRCPAIGEAGIKSTVCGPESFTPDHKPLVGPQPGVRGLYHCCGFNSMGIMLGGGIGREVARWMVEGAPAVDLFEFDCR
jgi:glycine/D-amino acid oxidase-like deaminating enzyme